MPIDFSPTAPRNAAQWNANDLVQQYQYASISGWLTYWEAAAREYGLEPEDIMAVDSRESGCYWRTRGAKVTGDKDKAFGLGQEHIEPGETAQQLEDPEFNIRDTAHRLSSNLIELQRLFAKDGLTPDPAVLEEMKFSSYNRGANGAYQGWKKTGNASAVTENGDYGSDCIARSVVFKALQSPGAP